MELIITHHAREKYREICDNCNDSDERTDAKIKGIFSKSKREKLTPELIIRMMNNGFEDVSYYRYERFRFVVSNKENVLLTFEKDSFYDKGGGFIRKKSLPDRKKR